MALALPIMAVAMVAGAAVSAVGAMQSAKAQSQAADFNAKINEQNATAAVQQSSLHAIAQERQAILDHGSLIAGYGAAGVTGEGSPLDVLSMSVANAELDRQTILYNGRLRATGYYNEATLAHEAGKTAESQGYYNAASHLLTGVGQAAYGASLTRTGTPITQHPASATTPAGYTSIMYSEGE